LESDGVAGANLGGVTGMQGFHRTAGAVDDGAVGRAHLGAAQAEGRHAAMVGEDGNRHGVVSSGIDATGTPG